MSEIRLLSEADADRWAEISTDAYPGFIHSPEEHERMRERLQAAVAQGPEHGWYGLYRDGALLGGMRLYDFTMKLRSSEVPAGGIGSVAVDYLHRKERVALELVLFALRHLREQGAGPVLLYPFRLDFYHSMGFGFGTKMRQYRLRPEALPDGGNRSGVRALTTDDVPAMLDCYHRYLEATNGLLRRAEPDVERLLGRPGNRVVGCWTGGRLDGYVVLEVKSTSPANVLLAELQVRELVYLTPDALSQLLTFLRTQGDQVQQIVFNTQDEYFHYLFGDPRDDRQHLLPSVYHETNTSGLGIMYRVMDIPGTLERLGEHEFGPEMCRLRLSVEDSLMPENAAEIILHFADGMVQVVPEGDYDVEASMDIATFSSLLVGSVNFRSLYNYGLARVSEPRFVSVLERVFAVDQKPFCLTPF